MALSAGQIAALQTVQTARVGVDTLIWKMQQDLAQAAKLLVPLSVAHNRTKVRWTFGEKVTIFLSPDDLNKINGFYFSMVSIEPSVPTDPLITDALFATIGVQYLYQFDYGNDGANSSERKFIENVNTFLVGLITLKAIQDSRLMAWSGDAVLTESAGQPLHYYNGRLKFRLCAL